ncbi:MAG: UvrD-helicase domain-containing protein [Treponemataceae bacterium]|nr:UvrD-helicase domain-containing protein [Treponemataceae bacterium]
MNLEQLKKELNPEQFRAVSTTEGALLIIAGAGSGKTRVITFRISHMLDTGIPQSAILALTFTNKAAREMEERVKSLTGRKLQNLTVSTFHAFGVRILRQDIDKLGWRTNFSIYDDTDRNQLIKDTGRELGFSADALDVYKIGNLFSNIKIGRWNWEHANDAYRQLYEKYQEGLKLYNAVDFDDLIGLPIRLFKEHPEVLAKYRERYKYIMVDEFQDTSLQQYEFMHLLADKNVAVVGDDDQSIYSWRGANYENIRMFERDFPEVQEIRLEQNYRSTETILAAANGVISHNTNRKDKSLWSGNGSGRPIEIYMPENEAAEADFIAETIQSICMQEKRSYDQFGVLIRANTLSRAIEEAFLNMNVPYTMSGGTSFFQRKEIKDVVSYLRVCANHDDDINLLRIINTPRRGIGRSCIEQLNIVAANKKCSLWDAIETVLMYHNGGVLQDNIDEESLIAETYKDDYIPEGELGSEMNGLLDEGSSKPRYLMETEVRKDPVNTTGELFADGELGSSTVAGYNGSLGAKTIADLQSFHDLIVQQRQALLGGGRGALSKKVRQMVEDLNYWDFLLLENPKSDKAARFKYMNIESLINGIEQWENNPDNFDTGLYAYLNRITLLSRDDMEDDSLKGKVNLMTIHASKGLEFPVVFIAGCEDGIIPHARSLEDPDGGGEEEERRLFYVAITRARDKLYLSCCRHRRKMQSVIECTPSPFLDEIPAGLVEYHEPITEISEEAAVDILQAMKARFAPPPSDS